MSQSTKAPTTPGTKTTTSELEKFPSIKLPKTCGYLYQNLKQYSNSLSHVCYYAVINGIEAYLVKHSDAQNIYKQILDSKHHTFCQAKRVPYDELDPITAAEWVRLGQTVVFVLGTNCGSIHVFGLETRKLHHSFHMKPDNDKVSQYGPTVNCITSNDRSELYVGLSNGKLMRYEVAKHGLICPKCLYHASGGINCLQFFNDKLYIATDTGAILVHNFATGKRTKLLKATQPSDPCVCMSVRDNMVAVGTASGHILIVSLISNTPRVKMISAHRRIVTAIQIEPDTNLIASVSEDGYLNVFCHNLETNLTQVIKSRRVKYALLCGVQFVKRDTKCEANRMSGDSQMLLTAERPNIRRSPSDSLSSTRSAVEDESDEIDNDPSLLLMVTAYDRNRIYFV